MKMFLLINLILTIILNAAPKTSYSIVKKSYYENGNIKQINIIENKKLNGIQKDFYQNGQLKSIYETIDNKINGYYKEYFEDGQIRVIEPYNDGKVNGLVKRYYNNGSLEFKAIYKNNKINGYYKEYNKKGLLIFDEVYIDGRIVSIKHYYENGNTKRNGLFNNFGEGMIHYYNKESKLIKREYYNSYEITDKVLGDDIKLDKSYIENIIKNGSNQFKNNFPDMPSMMVKDKDIKIISNYVYNGMKGTPPENWKICAGCHFKDGKGLPYIAPSLQYLYILKPIVKLNKIKNSDE